MKRFAILAIMLGMVVSVSAQNVASESKYGADSVNCVAKISIYREYYRQWQAAQFNPEAVTQEMITAWREVFLTCPRSTQNLYVNGEKIIDYLIRTNPQDKDAYIDTICMLMDSRAQYFPVDPQTGAGQVANIMGRKGMLIYNYNPSRYEEAYNVLKDAVALDPSQLQGAYLDAYFRATIDMVNNGKEENMTIINVYQELNEVIDASIKVLAERELELTTGRAAADSTGNAEAVANFDRQIERNERSLNSQRTVKNNIDNLFQPFASCEDLVRVFTAKMAENPNDINLLKRITTVLDKKECTDSQLFLEASRNLYELEPSPEAAYNIGIQEFKNRRFGEAARYFEQATASENNDRVYRAYRNMAFCYQNTGSFSRARDAARRAAQVDPTSGEPYLIIAQLYAESSRQFSGEIESKAVFWVAVDKCLRAKQVDPSIADRANSLIGIYSQHFPSRETIFFNDFTEGNSYTVGGWINETTTIRAAR